MSKTASIPRVYKAKDDSEHATKAAAEARNELYDAEKGIDEAVKRFQRLVVENAKTKDGHSVVDHSTFYRVRHYLGQMPVLEELYFYPRWCGVGGYGEKHLELRRYDAGKESVFEVTELYANKLNAERALLVAMDEQLAEYAAMRDKLRSRLESLA
jgi:hypothetical protein